jgi:chorismate synthase
MTSYYGKCLKLSIFGASHASEIGMTLEGIPAGLPIDLDQLQAFLNRRAPGQHDWATSRKEMDVPHFMRGITDDRTNGDPIHAVIHNENIRKKDYENIQHIPRPGHADYTAWMKYGLDFDMSGGGPFSGRMTAPMCIAGGLCKQWLASIGIRIGAHIAWIYDIDDNRFDPLSPDLDGVQPDFPVLNRACGEQMLEAIATAKQNGDSVGGIIECAVTGMPIGIGGPMFDGLEGTLASVLYAIPSVKGVDFGLGFANTYHPGSYTNDAFTLQDGYIHTHTNHCGGILGGISNGMPLLFRVAIKPTPSISKPQKTVNLETMQESVIKITGRHDPCIVPRVVPVVEAAAAIAIYDLILMHNQRGTHYGFE